MNPIVDQLEGGEEVVDEVGAPLAKREADVARLVAEGVSKKQIGVHLFISERTVDILNKLGFNSRAQIAAWVRSSNHERQRSGVIQSQRRHDWIHAKLRLASAHVILRGVLKELDRQNRDQDRLAGIRL